MYSLDYFNTDPIPLFSLFQVFFSTIRCICESKQTKPKLFPIIWRSFYKKKTLYEICVICHSHSCISFSLICWIWFVKNKQTQRAVLKETNSSFWHNLPTSFPFMYVPMSILIKCESHFLLYILTLLFPSLVWAWHLLASTQNNSSSDGSYFLLLYLSSTWSLSLGGYISAWHVQSTYNVWRRVRGAGWSNSEI